MALTTIARVKERLGITGSGEDALLTTILGEVEARILSALGREVEEATFTEYYDGTGQRMLPLRQGPLVSVTSVEAIGYSGTTSRTEDATTIEEANRLEGGLRSEGHCRNAWLEYISGCWTPGQRNYKVVYVAGWSTVPEVIAGHATEAIVASYVARESPGLTSKAIGDGSQTFLSPKQIYDAEARVLSPYRSVWFL